MGIVDQHVEPVGETETEREREREREMGQNESDEAHEKKD
jgi:hypothetical protein